MRTLSLLLALALVTLSGCTDPAQPDGDPGDGTAGPGDDTGGPGDDTGGPGDDTGGPGDDTGNGTPTNAPPVANLTADVVNGTAPLEVMFTLNGSDADGDLLDWTFDADGDGVFESEGTEFPATVSFTYAEGAFNATLTVSDGTNATQQSLAVAVAAGFTPWERSGTAQLPCPGCLPQGEGAPAPLACVGLAADDNEADCVFFELPTDVEGRSAEIVGDGLDGDWAEYAFLASCAADASVILSDAGGGGLETTVPAGAGCVVLYDSVFPGTTLTIVIS